MERNLRSSYWTNNALVSMCFRSLYIDMGKNWWMKKSKNLKNLIT